MSYLVPLRPEDILYRPLFTTKETLLHELVNRLNIFDDVQKDQLYQAILYREHIMSTGVGNGVAIPHAKIEYIDKQVLSIAILEHGIDFNAIDGEPVSLVFLVVGSQQQPKFHLRLLSHLSRSLMNLEWVDALKTANSKELVLTLLETLVQTEAAE